MNKFLTTVSMIVLSVLTANAQSIHTREVRQQQRIARGVRSGELTWNEMSKLERREANLHRRIRRDRLDGDGLSSAERRYIDRRQDQLSRQIYRESHDNQVWRRR